jgi:hypothetical protein
VRGESGAVLTIVPVSTSAAPSLQLRPIVRFGCTPVLLPLVFTPTQQRCVRCTESHANCARIFIVTEPSISDTVRVFKHLAAKAWPDSNRPTSDRAPGRALATVPPLRLDTGTSAFMKSTPARVLSRRTPGTRQRTGSNRGRLPCTVKLMTCWNVLRQSFAYS